MDEKVLKTYIAGFDEELGGGIPEGHIILLAGPPGSLKSTLAYNFAYRNAKETGAKVLYILLDKSKEKFMAGISKFGMDDAGGNINIYDLITIKTNLSQFKGGNWWEPFKGYLREFRLSFEFNIVVIDSLQVLEMAVKFTDVRNEMYQIVKWLEDELKVTGVLVSEMAHDALRYSRYDEDMMSDGIIHLSMHETESGVERWIRCVKMSGMPHNTNFLRLGVRGNEFYAEKIGPGKRPAAGLAAAPVAGGDSFSF